MVGLLGPSYGRCVSLLSSNPFSAWTQSEGGPPSGKHGRQPRASSATSRTHTRHTLGLASPPLSGLVCPRYVLFSRCSSRRRPPFRGRCSRTRSKPPTRRLRPRLTLEPLARHWSRCTRHRYPCCCPSGCARCGAGAGCSAIKYQSLCCCRARGDCPRRPQALEPLARHWSH